ncbi:hypothetical protein MTO96_019485 [Rhipicephalus appendiculatus]
MEHGTKIRADPERRSSASNPIDKESQGLGILGTGLSEEITRRLAKTPRRAMLMANPLHPRQTRSLRNLPHLSPRSKWLEGRQSTKTKDAAAPQKDTKAGVKVADDEEPAVDPREPLPNRAVIDRRVSLGGSVAHRATGTIFKRGARR